MEENKEEKNCPCCSGKHKERQEKEKKDLMNRLKRIEGQVRGIENMLEKDAYCTDVLIQVSAVTSALNSFNKVLLANHVKTCVADNIRQGNDEVIDELVTLLFDDVFGTEVIFYLVLFQSCNKSLEIGSYLHEFRGTSCMDVIAP